ncbi:MAG: type II secretion system F family protein [Eubacteriales bacterium]|nr:type II secretion system F family protein [Eubacteriales bacterium]MDD4390063.1 type II secretion system F family protein [Eubacteriales bacterium]
MKQFSYRELSVFCGQISMMVNSGILLHSGIQMIANDTSDYRKKEIFYELSTHMEAGDSIDVALQKTGAFPQYMLRLIKIGTRSGKLDSVMEALASYYGRQHTLKENIKSAIIYPIVLIAMMLIVLIFLTSKVMPVFAQVFHSLGTEISPWTAAIMNIGITFGRYSAVFAILSVLLFVALLLTIRTEKGRFSFFSFIMGRKIAYKFDIATFTSSMSLMLSGGLDIETAFNLSGEAVSSDRIKSKIKTAEELMRKGTISFSHALSEVAILSDTMTTLLSTGAQAGSVDSALQYIADIYEEEYRNAMMRRVSLIEPISVAVISILIGSILVSVMLPLLSILSGIS